MNLLCRLTIVSALLLLDTACLEFDPELKSQQLDKATWCAEPIADMNQDGCRDILLSASDPLDAHASDAQLRSWILSGRNLAPICSLAANPGSQGIGLIRVGASRIKDDNGSRDLLCGVSSAGEGEPTSLWPQTWFRVSPFQAAVVETSEIDNLDMDALPGGSRWMNLALIEKSEGNWWVGGNTTEGEDFTLWDKKFFCKGMELVRDIHDLPVGEQIQAAEVLLRDGSGEQEKAIPLSAALSRAEAAGLDLVQLSDEKQPACAILDSIGLRSRYDRVMHMQDADRAAQVTAAHPDLESPQLCGDVNQDGVLDWLGLVEKPLSVCIVSGADLSVLRTIPMSDHPMATVATGGFEVDDVDGDGVGDWVLGVQVSQSDDHVAPRTCKLGLISLVSGANKHVIRTLDRESFLRGAAKQCPLVRLPE